MKIYTFFGEFGFLNRFVISELENKLKNNKIYFFTVRTYANILKEYFKNNNNLILLKPDNDLYIEYRRRYHGNPGNEKNFKIINTLGYIASDSKLCRTNTWLKNSNFYKKWIEIEKPKINFNKKYLCLYDCISDLYPTKPWQKYTDSSNNLYDWCQDYLKQNNITPLKTGYTINKPLFIEPIKNDWIHIFAKKKARDDNQFFETIFYMEICKIIKKKYPDKKIFCHGTIESMGKELSQYVDYYPKNFTHSQNVLANCKLFISAWSGMGEFALNCNTRNLIYLKNSKNKCFNPFNANIYEIRFPKNVNDVKIKIIPILEKIFK
jgi:hypothetical protein